MKNSLEKSAHPICPKKWASQLLPKTDGIPPGGPNLWDTLYLSFISLHFIYWYPPDDSGSLTANTTEFCVFTPLVHSHAFLLNPRCSTYRRAPTRFFGGRRSITPRKHFSRARTTPGMRAIDPARSKETFERPSPSGSEQYI